MVERRQHDIVADMLDVGNAPAHGACGCAISAATQLLRLSVGMSHPNTFALGSQSFQHTWAKILCLFEIVGAWLAAGS